MHWFNLLPDCQKVRKKGFFQSGAQKVYFARKIEPNILISTDFSKSRQHEECVWRRGEEFVGLVRLASRNGKVSDLSTNPFLYTLISIMNRFTGSPFPLLLGIWRNRTQWQSKWSFLWGNVGVLSVPMHWNKSTPERITRVML